MSSAALAAPPPRPTMDDYRAYHSMVCPPRVARICSDSFLRSGGLALFMPSDYRGHFREHPPVASAAAAAAGGGGSVGDGAARFPHDATDALNVFSYYCLVLFSLTGLSTLLGLTDEVGASEFPGDGVPPTGESLRSARDPGRVAVDPPLLEYVARRCGGGVGTSDLRLKRRFEYDFRLLGVSVIMLHLTSPVGGAWGDEKGGEGPALHLVEVYHIRNPVVRAVGGIILGVARFVLPSARPPYRNRTENRWTSRKDA